jgi:hypothetical protein
LVEGEGWVEGVGEGRGGSEAVKVELGKGIKCIFINGCKRRKGEKCEKVWLGVRCECEMSDLMGFGRRRRGGGGGMKLIGFKTGNKQL